MKSDLTLVDFLNSDCTIIGIVSSFRIMSIWIQLINQSINQDVCPSLKIFKYYLFSAVSSVARVTMHPAAAITGSYQQVAHTQ